MDLPPNVRRVMARGKPYFYFQLGRGTPDETERVRLPDDPWSAEFAAKIKELSGQTALEPARSIRAMITGFRISPEWLAYAVNTRKDYGFYLDKLIETWGPLPAKGVRPVHVLALRDSMSSSPGSANYMLSVGRVVFGWAIPREFSDTNPFRDVKDLPVKDDGHWPWPDWALDEIAVKAPQDIQRFVFLATQTGQRESDVVGFGATAREGRGLMVRPKKTERSRKAFWVPLLSSAVIAIDCWDRTPLVLVNERYLNPITIPPGSHYLLSPAGKPYTATGLRSRWNRWLRTDDGKAFLGRWASWERLQRERVGETIPADAVLKPTLHGLRSTAVVLRRLAGYTDGQISNDIGMSLAMVKRYSRFMDQRLAAETNILLLENARKA